MGKLYTLKIYDKAGTTFKGVLNQLTSYSFQEVINGGLGEMIFEVPNKFDDTLTITQLDKVELWVQDKDTPAGGLRIYAGYVYKISRRLSGDNETVTVSAYGYATRFGFTPDMLNTTTISVPRLSMTVTAAIKDVIDKFITTIGDSLVNYSATSVDTVVDLLSYTASGNLVLETIERLREMAGATWYWKVDADGIFYFKQFPTTPTHTLIMGKDLNDITIEENSDDISNFYFLTNGMQADDPLLLQKIYYNSASNTAYWKRFSKQSDSRLTDPTYFDKLGTAFVTSGKDVNKALTFSVRDNNYGQGYDIEKLHVGDTVRILNNKNADLYNGNLVITGIDYTPEVATVMVADTRTLNSRSLVDIRRSLDTTVYEDTIGAVTLVSV